MDIVIIKTHLTLKEGEIIKSVDNFAAKSLIVRKIAKEYNKEEPKKRIRKQTTNEGK